MTVIEQPVFDIHYITLQGVSSLSAATGGQQISVMCGDEKPQIKSGWAKWDVVNRPLETGVTTFQGYDPVSMALSLRFGVWNAQQIRANTADPFSSDPKSIQTSGAGGWDISPAAAAKVESDIATLEWMAGLRQQAGPPPYVYASSWDEFGLTSNLIPAGYQTVGANGAVSSPNQWPWIIEDGIEWGQSWSNGQQAPGHVSGGRVYQECTVTLRNFMGFTTATSITKAGFYFKSGSSGRNTCVKIASSPKVVAQNPSALAQSIRTCKQNNPVHGTNYYLQRKSLSSPIPAGLEIWVPSHTV